MPITLKDLKKLAETVSDDRVRAGLEAFIDQASRLPAGTTVMSKIQRSFVDLAAAEKIQKAKTFADIKRALGSRYSVKIEPV